MAVWLAAVIAMAAEPEDSLVGAWVNQADANDTLEFFGLGIGENAQYFACTSPASDQVTLTYGGGSTETYTVASVNGDLHLTDAQHMTKVYSAATATSGCAKSLKQVAGAKAVFAADNPDIENPTLADLVGAYLTAIPASCPTSRTSSTRAVSATPTSTTASIG